MPRPQPHSAAARPTLDAVKVTRLSPARNGDVTYVVLGPKAGAAGDKRTERRWRTHLRSGKIVDSGTHVLTESQIRDQSARGARLKLAANVPLPRHIRFFDDNAMRMFDAVVAWQRGRDIGVTLLREVDPRKLTRAELFRLGVKIRSGNIEAGSMAGGG